MYHYDPALLNQFLDFAFTRVTFTMKQKSASIANLVIDRNRDTVMCGTYTDVALNGDIVQEWDMRVRYCISASRRWVPLEFATGVNARDMSRDASTIAKHGAMLTRAILVNKAWERAGIAKIRTTC
ncbi:hypothetical protein MMC26_005091 [Xylographa opegraphella]|nr:hypothetical protein [Xylographa opegraphella]